MVVKKILSPPSSRPQELGLAVPGGRRVWPVEILVAAEILIGLPCP